MNAISHAGVRLPNLALMRAEGARWATRPVAQRVVPIAALRRRLAAEALEIARLLEHRRPLAETIAAEILPLAEGARFLTSAAPRLLAPRRLGRAGRPLWLAGVRAEIRRDPLGCVLILAPGNYPLFLPGAQLLQALAAGNAVCVKPARGCGPPMRHLASLLQDCGLPSGLLRVLDDTDEAGAEAVAAGFDRIVLTGSAETGRRVLSDAAGLLTPCTMELSGNDAVFVLPGADLDLVVRCLAYGLRLNGGATCIAPRRVFLSAADADRLLPRLRHAAAAIQPATVPAGIAARLESLLAEARACGADVPAWSGQGHVPALVLGNARPGLGLLREDVFAPVLSLVPVASTDAALLAAAECPYALGASVFGPPTEATRFAHRVQAGAVTVNDVIVPTADPRLPFGGRGRSGFGVTRGAEGLLEMTTIKTVSLRTGGLRAHLDPPADNDADRLAALVALLHGSARARWNALRTLPRLIAPRSR